MWPFNKDIDFDSLDFRTDVHSHILPGVDDGFKSVEDSEKAIATFAERGLKRIILTPHVYPELYPDNSRRHLGEVYDSCKERLGKAGVSLRLAGEHMVYDSFPDNVSDESSYLSPLSSNVVLIEMSYAFESGNIRDVIFQLNASGYSPVLAHPERYTYYSRNLNQLRTLRDMDCAMQLNVLSLGGFYGDTAREKAENMLEQGLYDYLGTDIHSLRQFPMLSRLKIKRKHIRAVEKLLENNDSLWALGE